MAARRESYKNLIEVRTSHIQGRGVFARRRIRKGTRIIEYIGERIGPEEEAKRYDDDSMERHHTFLFAVDENTTIDGGRFGNESRFINHSCDPNCESVDVEGRIFIEAIRTIPEGTELTYDYNYEVDGRVTKKVLQRYICECGSPKCRKTILKIKSNGHKRRR